MGAGASAAAAGIAAAVTAAKEEELKQAMGGLSPDDKAKLIQALAAASGPAGGGTKRSSVQLKADGIPFKEWSKEEVAAVMKMFAYTDLDSDGLLDKAEFTNVCQNILFMEPEEINMDDADKLSKDGKIDRKEFFLWYTQCSETEADKAFKTHAHLFAKAQKNLKQWSQQEVVSVLAVFKDFDINNSGFIEMVELQKLCDVICIDVPTDLCKDGSLSMKDFFAFYSGCEKEEADQAFADYAYLFTGEKQLKEWSPEEVTSVLTIFKQFDANSDGKMNQEELNTLCDLLCIEAKLENIEGGSDGSIGKRQFFAFYVGCSKEEADKVFNDHADLFTPRPQ